MPKVCTRGELKAWASHTTGQVMLSDFRLAVSALGLVSSEMTRHCHLPGMVVSLRCNETKSARLSVCHVAVKAITKFLPLKVWDVTVRPLSVWQLKEGIGCPVAVCKSGRNVASK